RIQTMEEAQTQQDQIPTDERDGAVPQITQGAQAQEYGVAIEGVETISHEPVGSAVAVRSAFEHQLEVRFPIAKDRTAFVNQTVELLQDAMAQAWALRRL